MTRKTWVRIGFVAIVIVVAANLAILTAFPPDVQHRQEPINRVNWILVSAPGLDYRYPSESATIVYDVENDTWLLQDAAAWDRAIDLGVDYSTEPARPEEIRYTRDIAIEGGRIDLDFFVRNFAGEDCAHADFALTTEVGHLNTTTGSMEGDTIITGAPAVVPVDDLANGEWREVRVAADLPRPKQEEILLFSITLTTPCTFTTQNGTTLTYNPNLVTVIEHGSVSRVEEVARDPGYVVERLPRGNSATFIVQGTDAPGIGPLPTMTAG
ncbi:hypothetical protein FGU65_07710 [Methanoculleus sp. FWC-SCC1]|uniref:DUF4340 domain-containing protein n=2 Tax=Methanoculleus frigidifontis TaxID=2584085 RepID=A0ABT8MA11_9EURY|nr:hypothetical protein [Methanoculleus sp. FWC-SCC1]